MLKQQREIRDRMVDDLQGAMYAMNMTGVDAEVYEAIDALRLVVLALKTEVREAIANATQ